MQVVLTRRIGRRDIAAEVGKITGVAHNGTDDGKTARNGADGRKIARNGADDGKIAHIDVGSWRTNCSKSINLMAEVYPSATHRAGAAVREQEQRE